MSEKKQQYNELLKRISNAEGLLNNIDNLKAEGKVTKDDDFYINAYRKLIIMLGSKRLEIEKEINRKMTTKEVHEGFEI